MEKFVWRPSDGIDGAALIRLRQHFPRPDEPMGEAWFMGTQRRMFDELKGNLSELSVRDLQEPLSEIASGTSSFGYHAEWDTWYHYLLGQLLQRCHEDYVSSLLESLITGFMVLYPNGVHDSPYPNFLDDVLLTLGSCMMAPESWDGTDIVVGSFLHRSNNNPKGVWCWWDASGDFSASMFFCLKYLPPSQIQDWFQSVLDIPSPHWRAQVLVWLVGAHDMLMGRINWPSDLTVESYPSVCWEWHHCITPELAIPIGNESHVMNSWLPQDSREHLLNVAHSYFTEERFIEWHEAIARVPYLEKELAEIPATFECIYVANRA